MLDDKNLKSLWTGGIKEADFGEMLVNIVAAFNTSPFTQHNQFFVQVNAAGDDVECVTKMQPSLVGNIHFGILHGGVAATMLDSIGGLRGMVGILQNTHDSFEDRCKKVSRLATVDMRIDYLTAGRGAHFVATAELVRLGRKSCTTRMSLKNDADKLIAIGTASYAF